MFDGFYRQPPVYANNLRCCRELREAYPFLRVCVIGHSVLGREIHAYTIGAPCQATLFVGTVHGMEWLTGLLLIRFLEDACHALQTGMPLADIDLNRALETRALTVIPFLNPDGLELCVNGLPSAGRCRALIEAWSGGDTSRWQANAHGIDLNHNFDAGFCTLKQLERASGYLSPGPTRYGGEKPHSEPESAALVRWCEKNCPRQAYAYHSQGEEIYYRYGACTPPRSLLMAQVLSSVSGYRLSDPEGTASHGGFKDWFIRRFARPGFTIEIGRGQNPLPISDLEPVYRQLQEMMLVSVLL